MVEHKDTVLAVLGVSAGLSGFVLVFLGLVVATYQGFDGSTPDTVLARYRTIGVLILTAFAIGILCLTLAIGWLLERNDQQWLYVAVVVAFLTQIGMLVLATVATARRVLWEK